MRLIDQIHRPGAKRARNPMDSMRVSRKIDIAPVSTLRRFASMRLISNILDQSQGIVDSGVDITRGYRITDAEKLKTALAVAHKLLF